jgi:hypothetical protein
MFLEMEVVKIGLEGVRLEVLSFLNSSDRRMIELEKSVELGLRLMKIRRTHDRNHYPLRSTV